MKGTHTSPPHVKSNVVGGVGLKLATAELREQERCPGRTGGTFTGVGWGISCGCGMNCYHDH